MQVHVTLINTDERVRFSDYVDPYVGGEMSVGDIYRAMRTEFGRCTGKMYRDIKNDDGTWRVAHVGWVFLARDKYSDTNETYLREAWVELLNDPEPVASYEIAPY